MQKRQMTRWTVTLISTAVLTWTVTPGQNLVPNPSFEDTVMCPNAGDQVAFAQGWNNYSDESPDYFNSCNGTGGFGVPYNWGGYQPAASGTAYCALSAFFPSIPDGREIIGRNLLTPLTIGTKYFVSFQTNLSIDSFISATYACNKLGVLFSTIPYSFSSPAPLANFAHIYTDSIITDTLNWTRVFGSFMADSSYDFLSIGNFFNDANTDTLKMIAGTPTYIWAYYYIDDVCVSTDSAYTFDYTYTGINDHSIVKPNASFFPNPFSNQTTLQTVVPLTNATLTVDNCFGQAVMQIKNINGQTITLHRDNLASGLYFVRLTEENKTIAVDKLVITDK